MTIVVFDTNQDPADGNAFLRWKAEHRTHGFYLNQSGRHGWILHKAACGHTVMPSDNDMASNVKICATGITPLRMWLKEQGLDHPYKCTTCKPPLMPPSAYETTDQ